MGHSILLFLRANRRHLAELGLASLLVNAFVLALPLFTMLVYDKAVGNEIHDTLWALSLGMALLFVFELLLRLARVQMVEHAGARWDQLLDERLLRGVLAAPVSRPMPVGMVLARYREVAATRDVLSAQFLLPLADLPFALLFTVVLVLVAGPLVLIPLFIGALLLGTMALLYAASQRRTRLAVEAQAEKTGWLVDVLLARESVMGRAAARLAERGLREPSMRGARAGSRARLWQQFSQQMLPVGVSAGTVLMLVAGVYRIEAQALSVGGLISATMIGGRLIGAMCMFGPVFMRWSEFRRALSELGDVVDLNTAASADIAAAGPLGEAAAEGVRLEAVSLGYEGGRTVIEPLTLALRTDELVAVVGSSGAGKSTLLRLLAGHLAAAGGRLSVGARLIDSDAPRRWLAGAVAYKPQEPGFLAGTVADIVAPGESGAEEAILKALRDAGLGPPLERGELGLNTRLGANGSGLSGGQRQMLALARVLYQRADVMLLDEPTLGLDRQAQETLLAALPSYKTGRCLVVATHSAELIQIADRVLVFERGRLVADAPPSRLLAPGAVARPTLPRRVEAATP